VRKHNVILNDMIIPRVLWMQFIWSHSLFVLQFSIKNFAQTYTHDHVYTKQH